MRTQGAHAIERARQVQRTRTQAGLAGLKGKSVRNCALPRRGSNLPYPDERGVGGLPHSMTREANKETRRRREMRKRQMAQSRDQAPSGLTGSASSGASSGPATMLVCNFLDDLQAGRGRVGQVRAGMRANGAGTGADRVGAGVDRADAGAECQLCPPSSLVSGGRRPGVQERRARQRAGASAASANQGQGCQPQRRQTTQQRCR